MAVEFRGCKNLVFAEVTQDDATGYTTGEVKKLAPVAEIAKTVETSTATHYYDNRGAVIIDSEGNDTVTFTIAVPDDATYAEITGRTYDATKKMFIESQPVKKYFAVGYVLGEIGEGEDERYVWRLKGQFNQPDESSKTDDNGTDASNLSLVYTGVYTEHEFANGKGTGKKGTAKSNFIRKSANVATEEEFFEDVVTPDTTFT
jgi:phi13 family phage major tail protein